MVVKWDDPNVQKNLLVAVVASIGANCKPDEIAKYMGPEFRGTQVENALRTIRHEARERIVKYGGITTKKRARKTKDQVAEGRVAKKDGKKSAKGKEPAKLKIEDSADEAVKEENEEVVKKEKKEVVKKGEEA